MRPRWEAARHYVVEEIRDAGIAPGSFSGFLRLALADRKADVERELDRLRGTHRRILDGIRSGLIVTDRHGRIVEANRPAASLLWTSVDELIGHPVAEIFGENILPDAAHENPEHVHRAELRLTLQEKAHIVIGYSTSALVEPDGRVAGTIVVFTDVTEINHLKNQLIQSEKMAGIGTLAGGIAHEFNNLIGGMLGYAQLAEATGRIEDFRKCNDVVFQSSKRAKTIIGNLLAFARRVPNVVETVRLRDVVDEVVSLVARDLQKENIGLSLEIDPECALETDVGQFQQVILNLVINAKHAMMDKQGGLLTLRGGTVEGRVVLEVEDTGTGIPQEILPKIFEPFFTTKGSIGAGRVAGSGLGLSISYGILRELSGDVAVKATSPEGSTFIVTLPAAGRPAHRVAPARGPATDADEVPAAAPQRRILVIDDEPMIRELLGNVLAREGHEVVDAPNGFAAVERARKFLPDIAIIDAQMPGISGEETYAELRRENPNLTALMITGQVGDDLDEFARKMRAFGISVIHKPFDIEDIRQAVSRLAAPPTPGEGAA
ncbi:MAG: response regulator [Deltaproteobacteria bacterium]|nr:response regulator [Deltaproteobacteria bacterium]